MDINIIIGIVGTGIGLISVVFGILQWKSRMKANELYIQNLRRLWDMSRDYTPYRLTTERYKKLTDNYKLISTLEQSHTNFSTIFREITPLYIQAIRERLSYEFIKAMIGNGEIGSSWTLGLVLMEMPQKKRSVDKENECYDFLVESRKKLTNVKKETNKAQSELVADRDNLYNNSKVNQDNNKQDE